MKLAVALGALAAFLSAPVPAFASTPTTLPPSDQSSLHAFWNRYSVPAATQSALISKLESGQLLDAMTGAAPKSDVTSVAGDTTTEISTFADGSISVVTVGPVAAKPGVAQPQTAGTASCHVTSTTGNSNKNACAVSMNNGTISMSYNAYYTSYASAPSVITSVASFQWSCAGGTCSGFYLHIVRSTDQPSLSALAEGGLTFTAYGGVGGFNEWLRFFVHNGAASASYN